VEELANANRTPCTTEFTQNEGDDPSIYKSISDGPELRKHVEEASDFLDKVRKGYVKDKLLCRVVGEQEKYTLFHYEDGLVHTTNRGGHEVLCIPRVIMKDYSH